MRNLVLLSGSGPQAEVGRLLAFADLMGVSAKALSLENGWSDRVFGEVQPDGICLALSADTLTELYKTASSATSLQKLIDEYRCALLIFGINASMEHRRSLELITSGAVLETRPLHDHETRFTLPQKAFSFSRQLAGLSFTLTCRDPTCVFEIRNAPVDVDVILTANGHPMFLRVNRGSGQIFLLGGSLPCVDEPLSPAHGLEEHYDRLIPLLIFVRHCFLKTSWHSHETSARLIIDDPILVERYGFVDFRILMNSMQRCGYGTSIAFIPWNHWRTSRRDASRLLCENSKLTICIHGCDHTNKEFGAQDSALLDRKAGLAIQRMEEQEMRTGATFESVMVFPQGLFSRHAIPALRANNYLAAVNTTCFPASSGADELRIRDLLLPAVTRYSGFPIFQRRYPRRLFDFAFDIFLGRPALLVEHHEYFRDECKAMEEFVAELHKLEPALSWPSLTSQLARTCRQRNLSNGSVEVEFFTRRFELISREESFHRFLLSKHEPDSEEVRDVRVDGISVPFSLKKSFLTLEVEAEAGQVRNIEIIDRNQPARANGFGVVHNTRTLLRRGLSEFRDNTLSRHDRILRIAKGVTRALKVTGDS